MMIAVKDKIVFAGRQTGKFTGRQGSKLTGKQGRRLSIGRFQLGAGKSQWPSAEHNREQLE